MQRLRPFVQRNLALQEQIKAEIIVVVDGMFQLAQLYVDSLVDKTTLKAVRTALEQFQRYSNGPNDKSTKALDHAYNQAMERIEGQEDGLEDLAKRVLLWITYAKWPLSSCELQHALAVEPGSSKFDYENPYRIR